MTPLHIVSKTSVPYWFHAFFSKLREMLNVLRCAIWYYLLNLKGVKSTPRGMLLLVKLQVTPTTSLKVTLL